MFNEESGAAACVEAVSMALNKIPAKSYLIVVDDGSIDSTSNVLKSLLPNLPSLIVVSHQKNKGYGQALISGIKRAQDLECSYSLFMDSDLTNSPEDIMKFYIKMYEGFDVIKASRYSSGGGSEGVPFKRVIISRAGNHLAKFLFGLPITDCTNGFRAIKLSILQDISYSERGFSIIMEELFHFSKEKLTYANIPVILNTRSSNLRESSFQYSFETYGKYLKYPIKAFFYRLKYFYLNNH